MADTTGPTKSRDGSVVYGDKGDARLRDMQESCNEAENGSHQVMLEEDDESYYSECSSSTTSFEGYDGGKSESAQSSSRCSGWETSSSDSKSDMALAGMSSSGKESIESPHRYHEQSHNRLRRQKRKRRKSSASKYTGSSSGSSSNSSSSSSTNSNSDNGSDNSGPSNTVEGGRYSSSNANSSTQNHSQYKIDSSVSFNDKFNSQFQVQFNANYNERTKKTRFSPQSICLQKDQSSTSNITSNSGSNSNNSGSNSASNSGGSGNENGYNPPHSSLNNGFHSKANAAAPASGVGSGEQKSNSNDVTPQFNLMGGDKFRSSLGGHATAALHDKQYLFEKRYHSKVLGNDRSETYAPESNGPLSQPKSQETELVKNPKKEYAASSASSNSSSKNSSDPNNAGIRKQSSTTGSGSGSGEGGGRGTTTTNESLYSDEVTAKTNSNAKLPFKSSETLKNADDKSSWSGGSSSTTFGDKPVLHRQHHNSSHHTQRQHPNSSHEIKAASFVDQSNGRDDNVLSTSTSSSSMVAREAKGIGASNGVCDEKQRYHVSAKKNESFELEPSKNNHAGSVKSSSSSNSGSANTVNTATATVIAAAAAIASMNSASFRKEKSKETENVSKVPKYIKSETASSAKDEDSTMLPNRRDHEDAVCEQMTHNMQNASTLETKAAPFSANVHSRKTKSVNDINITNTKKQKSNQTSVKKSGRTETDEQLLSTSKHAASDDQRLLPSSASGPPYYNYVNRSNEEDDPLIPLTKPSRVPNFPVKMHVLLNKEDLSHIIRWMPHGRSWRLIDPVEFETSVIPQFLGHSNLQSFMRQANGWGFKRITKGRDKNSYYHEYFLRGMPWLVKKMIQPNVSRHLAKIEDHSNVNLEPDLTLISRDWPLPERADPKDVYTCALKATEKCILEGGPKARMPVTFYDVTESFATHTTPAVASALKQAQDFEEKKDTPNKLSESGTSSLFTSSSGGHPQITSNNNVDESSSSAIKLSTETIQATEPDFSGGNMQASMLQQQLCNLLQSQRNQSSGPSDINFLQQLSSQISNQAPNDTISLASSYPTAPGAANSDISSLLSIFPVRNHQNISQNRSAFAPTMGQGTTPVSTLTQQTTQHQNSVHFRQESQNYVSRQQQLQENFPQRQQSNTQTAPPVIAHQAVAGNLHWSLPNIPHYSTSSDSNSRGVSAALLQQQRQVGIHVYNPQQLNALLLNAARLGMISGAESCIHNSIVNRNSPPTATSATSPSSSQEPSRGSHHESRERQNH